MYIHMLMKSLKWWPTLLLFVYMQRKALGRELFELVAKTLGIREVTYFGLSYVDEKGYKAWLKDDKRVSGGAASPSSSTPSPANVCILTPMCGYA